MQSNTHRTCRKTTERLFLAAATLFAASSLSGCLVAGVSSSGGAFIWPGGLGLVLMLLVIFFLLRRR